MGSFGFSRIFFASPPPTRRGPKILSPPHQKFRAKTLTSGGIVSVVLSHCHQMVPDNTYKSVYQEPHTGFIYVLYIYQCELVFRISYLLESLILPVEKTGLLLRPCVYAFKIMKVKVFKSQFSSGWNQMTNYYNRHSKFWQSQQCLLLLL